MKRLVLASLLALLWLVPAHAQNQQCRTAPVGTSTANCASEAFVTESIAAAAGTATLQANPANPAGTTSNAGVMMGLGSTCKLTPAHSTRIKVEFIGVVKSSGAGSTSSIRVAFGTGAAPVNGVAATGTQVGNVLPIDEPSANFNAALANGGVITGLTPGTAYWLDLSLAVSGPNTATLANISCNAFEF